MDTGGGRAADRTRRGSDQLQQVLQRRARFRRPRGRVPEDQGTRAFRGAQAGKCDTFLPGAQAGKCAAFLPRLCHAEVPQRERVTRFCQAVSAFLRSNPQRYVAVHCTHGLNRTGFMIVSLLVDAMGYTLEAAVAAFALARAPGLCDANYLLHLHEWYKRPPPVSLPPPPPWRRAEKQKSRKMRENWDKGRSGREGPRGMHEGAGREKVREKRREKGRERPRSVAL